MEVGDSVCWFFYKKLVEGTIVSLKPLKVLTSSGTVKAKRQNLFAINSDEIYFAKRDRKNSSAVKIKPNLSLNVINVIILDSNFIETSETYSIGFSKRFNLLIHSNVPKIGQKFINPEEPNKQYTCERRLYKTGSNSIICLDDTQGWYGIISRDSKVIPV